MCEFSENIKRIVNDLSIVNNDVNIQKYSSVGYGKFNVNRHVYCNGKYKFAEEVVFAKNNNNEMAICIGYNPALACEKLDVSNKRLIRLLQKQYKGYYLLNLYPQITSKAKTCDMNDKINLKGFELIEKFLDIYGQNDIVLFFGRSVNFSCAQIKSLNSMFSNNRSVKLSQDRHGSFVHISRTWQELKEVVALTFNII